MYPIHIGDPGIQIYIPDRCPSLFDSTDSLHLDRERNS